MIFPHNFLKILSRQKKVNKVFFRTKNTGQKKEDEVHDKSIAQTNNSYIYFKLKPKREL